MFISSFRFWQPKRIRQAGHIFEKWHIHLNVRLPQGPRPQILHLAAVVCRIFRRNFTLDWHFVRYDKFVTKNTTSFMHYCSYWEFLPRFIANMLGEIRLKKAGQKYFFFGHGQVSATWIILDARNIRAKKAYYEIGVWIGVTSSMVFKYYRTRRSHPIQG